MAIWIVMAKKPKIHKAITEASNGLRDVMRDGLTIIADNLVQQVMRQYRQLIPSQKLKAIKNLTPTGIRDYSASIKNALSVIALDAITEARKEVPKKKNVRLTESEDTITLSEFDRLPKSVRDKILTQTQLLVGKQVGDIQKTIEFAYTTMEEETDSAEMIESEITDSAIGWIDGTAVQSGAGLNAASTINSARNAFFFDDEVSAEIEAFEFVNGDPVTEICQDLAGTIFSKDDSGSAAYQPPLHWNCKSYIIPILNGNLGNRKIEKLKPSTKRIGDQVQFSESPCNH